MCSPLLENASKGLHIIYKVLSILIIYTKKIPFLICVLPTGFSVRGTYQEGGIQIYFCRNFWHKPWCRKASQDYYFLLIWNLRWISLNVRYSSISMVAKPRIIVTIIAIQLTIGFVIIWSHHSNTGTKLIHIITIIGTT